MVIFTCQGEAKNDTIPKKQESAIRLSSDSLQIEALKALREHNKTVAEQNESLVEQIKEPSSLLFGLIGVILGIIGLVFSTKKETGDIRKKKRSKR